MKNIIFYHIPEINDYLNVFREQYNTIITSNLINDIDKLNICYLGSIDGLDKIKNEVEHTNVEIKHLSTDIKQYETVTAIELWKYAVQCSENENVLYIHSKGVSQSGLKKIYCDDWRKYMMYFLVEKYELCLKKLKDYDAVGVNLEEKPTSHFSGNFWWVNTDYIKSLENPEIFQNEFKKNQHVRMLVEMWHGSGDWNPYSLHESSDTISGKFHYNNRYLRSQYIK